MVVDRIGLKKSQADASTCVEHGQLPTVMRLLSPFLNATVKL